MGATCLHGPHHSAQKSTRTGLSDLRTCDSNSASVTESMLLTEVSLSDEFSWKLVLAMESTAARGPMFPATPGSRCCLGQVRTSASARACASAPVDATC